MTLDYTGGHFLESVAKDHLVYHEAQEAINNRKDSLWYENLRSLDDLFLSNLPDKIKSKYPEKVYYLRLYLLQEYLKSSYFEKELSFELTSKKTDIVDRFYNIVLDQFYHKNVIGNEQTRAEYNTDSLEKYIKNH